MYLCVQETTAPAPTSVLAALPACAARRSRRATKAAAAPEPLVQCEAVYAVAANEADAATTCAPSNGQAPRALRSRRASSGRAEREGLLAQLQEQQQLQLPPWGRPACTEGAQQQEDEEQAEAEGAVAKARAAPVRSNSNKENRAAAVV